LDQGSRCFRVFCSFKWAQPVARGNILCIFNGNKQMKIASFLAMTTILMAQGRNIGRQHKNSGHCEEERRGNLPYFSTRSTGCTRFK